MTYRALGITSNAITKTLEFVFASFEVSGQNWKAEVKQANSIAFSPELWSSLTIATQLSATDYLQLHSSYGHWVANNAKQFIQHHQLDFQVQLIGFMGYAAIDMPAAKFTHSLGDAAAIAVATGVNVVSDYRSINLTTEGRVEPVFSLLKTILTAPEGIDEDAFYAAFFAVLRWREENNIQDIHNGAIRNYIGGAVWMGQF